MPEAEQPGGGGGSVPGFVAAKPAGPILIYDVVITSKINEKINSKKPGVNKYEVWDVCYSRDHHARWNFNEERGGWRVVVRGNTLAGRSLRIILHPVDVEQGKWRLKTAIAED
jgi:hypothetical protein